MLSWWEREYFFQPIKMNEFKDQNIITQKNGIHETVLNASMINLISLWLLCSFTVTLKSWSILGLGKIPPGWMHPCRADIWRGWAVCDITPSFMFFFCYCFCFADPLWEWGVYHQARCQRGHVLYHQQRHGKPSSTKGGCMVGRGPGSINDPWRSMRTGVWAVRAFPSSETDRETFEKGPPKNGPGGREVELWRPENNLCSII